MANSLSSIVAGMSGEREMYVTYLPLSTPGPQGLALKMISLPEFQCNARERVCLGKNVSEGKYKVRRYVDYIVLGGKLPIWTIPRRIIAISLIRLFC